MKRRRRIIAIASLVVFILAVVIGYFHYREPTYQGKTVTEWIRDYRSAYPGNQLGASLMTGYANSPQVGNEAGSSGLEALHAMGPAALPYLIVAVHTNANIFSKYYARIYPHLPKAVSARLTPPVPPSLLQENALFALQEMRSEALPVLPQMIELLGDKDPLVRQEIYICVQRLRSESFKYPEAWNRVLRSKLSDDECFRLLMVFNPPCSMKNQALARFMSSSDIDQRKLALYVSMDSEDTEQLFIPYYRKALSDSEAEIRQRMTYLLMFNKNRAQLLLPELKLALRDRDENVRCNSALVIENVGAQARTALPDLERAAREDPDEKMRQIARRAADKLRPDKNKNSTNE